MLGGHLGCMLENVELFDTVLGINHSEYAVTSSTSWAENDRVKRRLF